MATIYLTDVVGDGETQQTAYRPGGFDGVAYAALMIDEARGRAIVVSPVDTVTGAGVRALIAAIDFDHLHRTLQASPPPSRRTAVNNWLQTAGYELLPDDVSSWWDVIHCAARQVNPAADLALTYA